MSNYDAASLFIIKPLLLISQYFKPFYTPYLLSIKYITVNIPPHVSTDNLTNKNKVKVTNILIIYFRFPLELFLSTSSKLYWCEKIRRFEISKN